MTIAEDLWVSAFEDTSMRFTIKTKLALTFTVLTLLSCVMAGLAIINLSSLNAQIDEIVNGPSAQVQNADDIEINSLYMIRAEKNLILILPPSSRRLSKQTSVVLVER